MLKKSVLITLAVLLAACSQWKTTTLRPKRLCHIPSGSGAGQIFLKTDDDGFEDISPNIGVFDNRILATDNNLKRVQVLNLSGEPELVIGNTKNVDSKAVKTVNFNFNMIGVAMRDENGNIYIQNRLNPGSAPRAGSKEELDFYPSFIAVFSKNGELQHTLGQTGTPDVPFAHIESLEVDSKGRLFVISRSFDLWSVYVFSGKKRDKVINLGQISFLEKEGGNTFKGRIDNVKVSEKGDRLIISVAYYHELRLKYLKMYIYEIEENGLAKKTLNIPDPKNVLFSFVDDKYFYFWNVTGSDVKFLICNMDGNIVNNIQLRQQSKGNAYFRVQGDRSGRFYSYSVSKRGAEVYRWE